MAKLTLNNITSGYHSTQGINTNNDAIETWSDSVLSLDGTLPNTMGANLDMGSYRGINLADGINAQDAVTLNQLQGAAVTTDFPAQTGHAGEFLHTDGSVVSWVEVLTQLGITYNVTEINNGVGHATQFRVHESATPAMSVAIDAGQIFISGSGWANAFNDTTIFNITAPVTNPRIDSIVLQKKINQGHKGQDEYNPYDITRIAGTEAASPVKPYPLPPGSIELATIALTVGMTEITDSDITDVRPMWTLDDPAFIDIADTTSATVTYDYNNKPIIVDSGIGAVTVNLPVVPETDNLRLRFIKNSSDVNVVSITPNGSETIDGVAAAKTLTFKGDILELVSDYDSTLSDWIVVQEYPIKTKGCSLYITAASQSIPDVTNTAIAWTAETYDTDAFHDVSTNNSRITIPAKYAGKYVVIKAKCWWSGNATGYRQLTITKNGLTVFGGATDRNDTPHATLGAYTYIETAPMLVASADYFEIIAYQSSGGALNINGGNASEDDAWVILEVQD